MPPIQIEFDHGKANIFEKYLTSAIVITNILLS